ncbi:M20/M25/M40 family metallo-hydrolase [Ornithinimicrobium sp. F0845]|uniref:M20/M25/M40 family metallo-hydrolase n=1 Tax=Ornithinimicrobium sp. F0845 TaxID=2926412 RepID=UPI001FF27C06|nr:M20/M25/M40 family metallo-hydrolase [Ornithinimicrobium sp. F0845]MCK0110592.1 M20/M25/M40 family metallo-hydrolase [Ornithinimicrobium sp. F0845]
MHQHTRMRRFGVLIAAGGLAVSGLVALPSTAAPPTKPNPVACDNRNNNTYPKLLDCVSGDGAFEHLEAFQAIADEHGSRAEGTPGYQASVDYVIDVMEDAGWDAEAVPFDYEGTNSVVEQLTPVQATYSHYVAEGSGEGDVTAAVSGVDLALDPPRASTSGCEAADFDGFTPGDIALVQRGTCAFGLKAENAEAAGASAVLIMNQCDTPDRCGPLNPTLVPSVVTIPVVGLTYADGEALAQDGSTAHVQVDYVIKESLNVIAELPGRNDNNVVMAGAHLDSVEEGAGINDNGSGSAGLLEVAQKLGNHKPQNTLRFAFWGAEEIGLIGSTEWVADQSQEELDRIALYLNFDMIGSPNYYLGVYDANESTFPAPAGVPIPEGSVAIERTFESFYTLAGEPYDDSQFSGRSDYQAFIANDIPSGGLFTGAEGVKTDEQAAIWGGTAGDWFDPCYHQACDDLGNVSMHALDVNVDSVAFAVLTFAYSTESVNGVKGKKVPGNFRIPAPAGPEGTFAT